MRIAIIGAGISGLGAAYLLHPHHDIAVYEKNDYIGGHSRTIEIKDGDSKVPVDTGFIVFNNWNYPNLMGLFSHLNIAFEKTDMSFGIGVCKGWLEYGSDGLFAQKINFFRAPFWRMIFDILRFNKAAEKYLTREPDVTLGQCLDELKMGDWFRRYYLLAMGAAIWSCPISTILEFPAATYVRFFKNHGLLNIFRRPQWYTVTGGSRTYVQNLTSGFKNRIYTNKKIIKVERKNGKLILFDDQGNEDIFDQIIFACHPDEARSMIEFFDEDIKSIIGSFRYQENKIIVHRDPSFMPEHKKCWSSWNYLNDTPFDHKPVVSLTYWMNRLQNIQTPNPVLVTLNPGRRPEESMIFDEHVFSHPIFDEKAIRAQNHIETIQGKDGLWFCGAYQRYGFHEDGLLSAVKVAKKMGARIPWE